MPFTAPPRRDLTPFEQRTAAGLEAVVWLSVGWYLVSAANVVVMGAIMATLALVGFPQATAWYANRFSPRSGLSRRSRSFAPATSWRGRSGRWFGAAARPGLGFTVLGLVILGMCAHDVYGVRGEQHNLAARGVRTGAVVTGLSYDRGGVVGVQVAYTVRGEAVVADLDLFGSVPSGLHRGSQLAVVYDPQHSQNVMLRSQVHGGIGTVVLFLATALAFLGAGLRLWWVRSRPGFVLPPPDQIPMSRSFFSPDGAQ